ncbi:hypothetical protein [Paraburkholderia sp. CNPSo 3281]|uniref:hypothetical protein n=1 Tax=Paraburkholderia sp. CNPSo 3281 TaxID=2940933 RepID=UPI0035CD1476
MTIRAREKCEPDLHGKHPDEAKALELAGWHYPKRLAGSAYGAIVHGDVAGIEARAARLPTGSTGWVAAGMARIDRMGYYEPYASSHDTLDADMRFREEVAGKAVVALRAGKLHCADERIEPPRAK